MISESGPDSSRVRYSESRRLHLVGGGGGDNPIDIEKDIVSDPSVIAEHTRLGQASVEGLPDPYPDETALEFARRDVTDLVNALVDVWADRLNSRHSKNYSVDFWRMLLLPWLCEIVQRTHARWRSLELIAAEHAAGSVQVRTIETNHLWPFLDVRSFQEHLYHHEKFGWWLDSVLLDHLSSPAFKIEVIRVDPELPVPKASESGIGRIGFLRRAKLSIGLTDIIGARYWGLFLAIYASMIGGRVQQRDMQPRTLPDWHYKFPAGFLNAIDQILTATIPKTYTDNFRTLEMLGQSFRYRKGRVRIGSIDYWNDEEKIVAALAREAGENFAVTQHGSFYGQMRYNVLATEGEYKYGRFFSWGFDKHDDYVADFTPLPSPYLAKLRDRHRLRNNELIIVGDPIRFGVTRIAPQPRGGEWLNYCSDTVEFLSTLDDEKLDNTVFRPYVNAQTDITDEHIVRDFPQVGRLEGDLHARMCSCRLLVLCSPNTTMILAMAANVPMVAFWRPEYFSLSPTAQPFFEELRSAGILFHSPREAASTVNGVWKRSSEWWSHPVRQSARRNWSKQFARSDRNWRSAWIREILKTAYPSKREKWRR